MYSKFCEENFAHGGLVNVVLAVISVDEAGIMLLFRITEPYEITHWCIAKRWWSLYEMPTEGDSRL